jgi:hypothetical protein
MFSFAGVIISRGNPRPANTTLFARVLPEDSSRAVTGRARANYAAKLSRNVFRISTRLPIFSKRVRKS